MTSTRQPFGILHTPRLQALSSIKNRQNALPASFSAPPKIQQAPGKRSFAASTLDDDDSENMDPAVFNSPTKRSKTGSGLSKSSQSSQFHLVATPPIVKFKAAPPAATPLQSVCPTPQVSSQTGLTPISLSRGSPKHKRVGVLSKRRASSSPFRRIDPPSFSRNAAPELPFSIDAALSGTIPSYTPKSVSHAPVHVSPLEESMPKSWFFDIHEDTPEQEATNLMEHSACVLDISSDDDENTKRRNEDLERGKENIPPPEYATPMRTQLGDIIQEDALSSDGSMPASARSVRFSKLRAIEQDAMDQDRSPLSDLPAAEFYGPGLNASSAVTVDAGIENPSGLSKELELPVEGRSEQSQSIDAVAVPAPAPAPAPAPSDCLPGDSKASDSAENPLDPAPETMIATTEPCEI